MLFFKNKLQLPGAWLWYGLLTLFLGHVGLRLPPQLRTTQNKRIGLVLLSQKLILAKNHLVEFLPHPLSCDECVLLTRAGVNRTESVFQQIDIEEHTQAGKPQIRAFGVTQVSYQDWKVGETTLLIRTFEIGIRTDIRYSCTSQDFYLIFGSLLPKILPIPTVFLYLATSTFVFLIPPRPSFAPEKLTLGLSLPPPPPPHTSESVSLLNSQE